MTQAAVAEPTVLPAPPAPPAPPASPAPPHPAAGRVFHVSLNVADLDRSVGFYRALFGQEPAKCRPDYAKFELADPPVALSLEPQRHAPGGALNHLGLRVRDPAALVDIQRRLESAGLPTQREDNVECCYARQTKFWVADPDRNSWEIYVVEADLGHKGRSPAAGGPALAANDGAGDDHGHGHGPGAHGHATTGGGASPTAGSVASHPPTVWEHKLGDPVPARLPLATATADEVMLRGSFNADLPPAALAALVAEARRALRPGGRVTIHGLVADRPLASRPALPGPAAAVERVPTLAEPLAALSAAGFVSVRLEKLGAACCFRHEGVGLRELLASAVNPVGSAFDLPQTVVYAGPMSEVRDDLGHTYRRGVPVEVPRSAAELLRDGPAAGQFVFPSPGGAR